MKDIYMNRLLLLTVMLCLITELSYAKSNDYSISSSKITITNLTDEAKAKIEAAENKENSLVIIKKGCTQECFSAICQLAWIRRLEIEHSNNNIVDLSSLSNLKRLQKIKIALLKTSRDSPIDVSPLAQLTNLVDIDFYGTKIKNTQALSGLKNLRRVSLHMSNVDSIDFLKGTPEVEVLILYGPKHTFKNYKPLLNLKKLSFLDIYMNKQATDELLAPLCSLKTLKTISMGSCKNITTLSFLSSCKDMKTINTNSCRKLKDISVLQNMNNIESVDISSTSVSRISELSGKVDLKKLKITGSPVTEISSLKTCTSLKYLFMGATQVKDISPLAGCRDLRTLEIYNTPVDNVLSVINCDNLTRLGISKTVSQDQVNKLKEVFTDLIIKQR